MDQDKIAKNYDSFLNYLCKKYSKDTVKFIELELNPLKGVINKYLETPNGKLPEIGPQKIALLNYKSL